MKKMYITMLSAFLSMFLSLGCSDDNLIPGRGMISSSDSLALQNVYDSLLSYRYRWDTDNGTYKRWWVSPAGVNFETNTVNNTIKVTGIVYEDNMIWGGADKHEGKPHIPNSLFALKDLHKLEIKGYWDLEGNLSGISQLSNLDTLIIHNLSTSSVFPEELTQCTNLKYLELINCRFNGRLPESIGNLKSLETLRIEGTDMDGELPESIGNLTSLRTLVLYNNNFSGNIPQCLSKLTNAEHISLAKNHFSGMFPIIVLHPNCFFECHENDIESLDFSVWQDDSDIMPPYLCQNKLTGEIPSWVFSTQKWQKYNNYVDYQQSGYGYSNNRVY